PAIRVRGAESGDPAPGAAGAVVEVVTDDMPFLVESVLAAVSRAGGEASRPIHPIVVVRRAPDGKLAEVLADADPADPPAGTIVESWIHVDLGARAPAGLADVLPAGAADEDETDPADVGRLLRWFADGHLTFLGYRYQPAAGSAADGGPGLGLMRHESGLAAKFSPGVAPAGTEPELLLITRATVPSPLRPAHPYYLALRDTDEHGALRGEHRFIGTLTVLAQHESVLDIPLVERR